MIGYVQKSFYLNIDKSNFVLFHPPQKKITSNLQLTINSVSLRQESCIKYLGIYIDSNFNWKSHIDYIAKKIKRSIGILSKLRYYVDNRIIINLYYALIYPFLIYRMIAWGSTYHSNVQPLFILQNMTFSKFDEHSSPFTFHIAIFMMKIHNNLFPSIFNTLFTPINCVHSYNTRSAAKQSYYIPKIRTNYGLFNIRFQGPKVWNSIEENI